MWTFIRILICIVSFGFALYSYIDEQNELTELRLELPKLEKEVHLLLDENNRLQYEIEKSESPIRLIHLQEEPQYQKLIHPSIDKVWIIGEGSNEKS
jgi:hypothetical protein